MSNQEFDQLLKNRIYKQNQVTQNFLFDNTVCAKVMRKNKELPAKIISEISNKLRDIEKITVDKSTNIPIPTYYYLKNDIFDILAEVLEKFKGVEK